jgi:hypothetical protein
MVNAGWLADYSTNDKKVYTKTLLQRQNGGSSNRLNRFSQYR